MLSLRTFGLTLSAAVVLASTAVASPEQARDRFQKAADGLSQLRSLSCTVESYGEGDWFASMIPKTETRVLLMRAAKQGDGPAPWLARYSGRHDDPEAGVNVFVVVSDGTTTEWVDHENKTVVRKPAAQARGQTVDMARSSTVRELAEPEPFKKQLAAPSLEITGTADIAGVPCEVIDVDHGENQQKERWYIATTDGLPRRHDLFFDAQRNSAQIYMIKDLAANPELRPEMFAITVPDGFKDLRTPDTAARPAAPLPAPPGAAAPAAPANGAAPAPAQARKVGTAPGDLAPDFELARPDGTKVRLSDLRGHVVLLDFWGTWCPPCRAASPDLQALHERFADRGLRLLGLAVRERNDQAPTDYFSKTGLTYTLLLRADEVSRQYRIRAFPTFVVIGAEGQIVHTAVGVAPETFPELNRIVEEQLAKAERGGAEPAGE